MLADAAVLRAHTSLKQLLVFAPWQFSLQRSGCECVEGSCHAAGRFFVLLGTHSEREKFQHKALHGFGSGECCEGWAFDEARAVGLQLPRGLQGTFSSPVSRLWSCRWVLTQGKQQPAFSPRRLTCPGVDPSSGSGPAVPVHLCATWIQSSKGKQNLTSGLQAASSLKQHRYGVEVSSNPLQNVLGVK